MAGPEIKHNHAVENSLLKLSVFDNYHSILRLDHRLVVGGGVASIGRAQSWRSVLSRHFENRAVSVRTLDKFDFVEAAVTQGGLGDVVVVALVQGLEPGESTSSSEV